MYIYANFKTIINKHIYISLSLCTHKCIHTKTDYLVCIHRYLPILKCVCVYIYVYIYIYIYMYIHICIYIHTHV